MFSLMWSSDMCVSDLVLQNVNSFTGTCIDKTFVVRLTNYAEVAITNTGLHQLLKEILE